MAYSPTVTARQRVLWTIFTFILGFGGACYILIFGAPEAVLTAEGEKTIGWYLNTWEEQVGRVLLSAYILISGTMLALFTFVSPASWWRYG